MLSRFSGIYHKSSPSAKYVKWDKSKEENQMFTLYVVHTSEEIYTSCNTKSFPQKSFCLKDCRLNWLVCWTVIGVWFKMDSFCVFCSGGMQWGIAVSWCSYVKPWFVVIYGKLGLGSRCLKLVPSCPNMLTILPPLPPWIQILCMYL